MKIRIVVYIAFMSISLLPAFFINSVYGYLPFFFLFFLSILSFIYMLFLKSSVESMDLLDSTECERGEQIKLKINIKNKSFLVFPRTEAVFTVTDDDGKNIYNKFASFMLSSFENKTFDIGIEMKHIGEYKAGLKHMKIFGLFGIIALKIKTENSADIIVKPKIYNYHSKGEFLSYSDNSSQFSACHSGGSDYSGVREYVSGDAIKNIHWKLSGKGTGLYSKQFERFSSGGVCVIIDLVCSVSDRESAMEMNDAVVETALSVAHYAKKYGYKYEILYSKDGFTKRFSPPHFYELSSFISEISECRNKNYDAAKILEEQCSIASGMENVVFCSSNINKNAVQLLAELKNGRKQPSVYYITQIDSSESEANRSLIYLEENNIRYSILTSAKELQNVG